MDFANRAEAALRRDGRPITRARRVVREREAEAAEGRRAEVEGAEIGQRGAGVVENCERPGRGRIDA